MTSSDPGTTPPHASQEISALAIIGGLLTSLIVGGAMNILAGMIGMTTGHAVPAVLIGAIPGVILMLASRSARRNGFAQGLLIGGCIVTLIGGACGAALLGIW